MSAGKPQVDSAGSFFHGIEVGLEALATPVILAGNLLVRRQDAHSPVEVYENIASFNFLHDAGNDLAFFAAEFSQDGGSLGFSDPLDDDLLGGLSGDAAVIFFGLKRKDQLVFQLGVFLYFFGVFNQDMLFRIEADTLVLALRSLGGGGFSLFLFRHPDDRIINDYFDLGKNHFSGIGIECGPHYLVFLAVIFLISGGESHLYGFYYLLLWNPALFF